MVALTRLALTDFRNHAAALIAPGPGFVILSGENGAGKTNILEAVSLLAPGRGLRGATLSAMARGDGPGGFAVAARLLAAASAEDVALGTGTLAAAPERRQVRINGAEASATALGEWLSLLWLTPAMDRLFVEGPGERRRFLDRLALALAPGHAHHSARYEAAMRQRNRILADAQASGSAPDSGWLGALEARMAEHGAAIAEARRVTVDALGERLAAQVEGPFARAGLSLEGWDGDGGTLLRELAEGRRRDAAAGRTLSGPHRADLIVTHLGKPVLSAASGRVEGGQAAHLCSTGEQKALLLGLVLAHAELTAERTGAAPILLLDEVAAHLDPGRRAALFERLAGAGQVWMTGTEPELFDAVPGDATRYRVADGKLG